MTFFVLEYRYADLDARDRTRPDHLAYMKSLQAAGTVVLAGPIGDGSGAMVVLNVSSEEEAKGVVKDDPYTAAEAATDHVLRPWKVVIPAQAE